MAAEILQNLSGKCSKDISRDRFVRFVRLVGAIMLSGKYTWGRIYRPIFIYMDYTTKEWKTKRNKILRRDRYIDKLAARYGKTIEAEIVHHIYPAEDYPEYAWEDWNLISVSRVTHNKLHDRTTDKLTKMGRELMERTTPKERRKPWI